MSIPRYLLLLSLPSRSPLTHFAIRVLFLPPTYLASLPAYRPARRLTCVQCCGAGGVTYTNLASGGFLPDLRLMVLLGEVICELREEVWTGVMFCSGQ